MDESLYDYYWYGSGQVIKTFKPLENSGYAGARSVAKIDELDLTASRSKVPVSQDPLDHDGHWHQNLMTPGQETL